jgi:hypothetical protein
MLDVTCHRNLETTYQKDLEAGGGGKLKITAEIPFHCSFRIQIPIYFSL